MAPRMGATGTAKSPVAPRSVQLAQYAIALKVNWVAPGTWL